jgi:hypothetical protein
MLIEIGLKKVRYIGREMEKEINEKKRCLKGDRNRGEDATDKNTKVDRNRYKI